MTPGGSGSGHDVNEHSFFMLLAIESIAPQLNYIIRFYTYVTFTADWKAPLFQRCLSR